MHLDAIKAAQADGYLYLATPYSKYEGGLEEAFTEAAKAAGWFLKNGINVFCPIAHTHPLAIYGELNPVDHDIWMKMDRVFMVRAEGLIVYQMPGWHESKGVNIEIEYFESVNKPIFYVPVTAIK